MSQMADGEGTGDGRSLIPYTNEEHVDGLSSSTKSLTKAGPEPTNIDAVLVSLPVSKQNQPPTIPPKLIDPLVKEKGGEQELEGEVDPPPTLEDRLKKIYPELVRLRASYLQRRDGFQHRYKHVSSKFIRKAKLFVGRLEEFSLDEILSAETDLVFLQELLDHIYSLETEQVAVSPLRNSPPASDPMLELLTAAPACYRRGNAELLPPILDEIS